MSDCPRTFPVLLDCRTPGHPECPRSIPWSAIAPLAEIVRRDYGQSLETAALRGGFTPVELFGIFRREKIACEGCCRDHVRPCQAVAFLLGLVSGRGEGCCR